MNIQFYLSNIPLPAAAHSAVERQLLKLGRMSRTLEKAQVDISKDRRHQSGDVFRVEINITPVTGPGLRGVANGRTIVAAAGEAIQKLERQLVRKKEQPRAKRRD